MTIQQATQQKVLPREEIATIVQRRQQIGERAVFTNGCFDLLHLGHVRYLQEARSLGDFLVLGLNSDESVRSLKGPTRPLVPEQERAEILAALSCIDYVTIFPEPTAGALIDLLQPAIYVKGADYATSPVGHGYATSPVGTRPCACPPQDAQTVLPDTTRLPEAKHVLAYGGTIRLISYVPQHSTSELIQKIKCIEEKLSPPH
jgi:D-beta-D-heptose 7-phosphate kinase/D-beta-D-heptose 1-phosphate adenosyltransferase